MALVQQTADGGAPEKAAALARGLGLGMGPDAPDSAAAPVDLPTCTKPRGPTHPTLYEFRFKRKRNYSAALEFKWSELPLQGQRVAGSSPDDQRRKKS